jgi:hypothetical protein
MAIITDGLSGDKKALKNPSQPRATSAPVGCAAISFLCCAIKRIAPQSHFHGADIIGS